MLLAATACVLSAAASGAASTAHVYSARDLPRIVDPKPALPGWSFEEGDPYIYPVPAHAPAFTLREWLGASPSKAHKTLSDKLKRAGFLIGRHKTWSGEHTAGRRQPADAVVFAFLFRRVSGARTGYSALRGVPGNQAPGAKVLGTKGLGEQARGEYEPAAGGNEGAAYLWRRGNIVIVAEMVCDGECGFPVTGPARAYASALDARAKRTP
jgi:hypothetical protein